MDLVSRVDRVVDDAIENERIVGSVTLVADHGEIVYARAAGWFDREAETPMRRDAIFRLASVTKPLVAATALAMVDRRLIGLDNAVSDHLPYFRPKLPDGSEARILVRHLLSHTSGLGYAYRNPEITVGLQQTDLDHEANLTLIAEEPLLFEPGTAWEYGASIDVLGAIIATIHGGTLDDALHHYVTDPLEMADTGFAVTDESRLAIPYADGPPGLRRMADPDVIIAPDGGETQFAPSRIFNEKAFQSGGAGAVGTPDDLLHFFETIRQGGSPILRHETVAIAGQNQVGSVPLRPQDAGQRFGFLGAIVDDPEAANSPQAVGTIRWGGVYGHDWSIDPANGITIVSMTNTPYEGCIGNYPKQIRNAVYDYTPRV
ncbi:serine hydrolase domain-containing protein [Devosia sp.]|uniref:serine hydrolase domain-containing protein n=1 Tax=Devosia sp. TaxID=1871048 RepID=UPI003A90171A